VSSLAVLEIFAGKINALLSRTAPRDLYDVYNMIKSGFFQEKNEREMLRKAVVFYRAISQKEINEELALDHLNRITPHQIRTDLIPVIQNGEVVALEKIQKTVRSFMSELMILTNVEREFIRLFSAKEYRPELLFNDDTILERIRHHPMAIWKMQEHSS
jgi:predicted nucleotidyltransferase component of viral defense system